GLHGIARRGDEFLGEDSLMTCQNEPVHAICPQAHLRLVAALPQLLPEPPRRLSAWGVEIVQDGARFILRFILRFAGGCGIGLPRSARILVRGRSSFALRSPALRYQLDEHRVITDGRDRELSLLV